MKHLKENWKLPGSVQMKASVAKALDLDPFRILTLPDPSSCKYIVLSPDMKTDLVSIYYSYSYVGFSFKENCDKIANRLEEKMLNLPC